MMSVPLTSHVGCDCHAAGDAGLRDDVGFRFVLFRV